jgi:hypothetical protein
VRSSYNNASSTSDGSNTAQLFFPQSLVDSIDTTVGPYSSHGANSTTNAGDRVYTQQTKGVTLLSLSGSASSFFSASRWDKFGDSSQPSGGS